MLAQMQTEKHSDHTYNCELNTLITESIDEEIEQIIKDESEDTELKKQIEELKALMNESMSQYKTAMDTTFSAIMEGKDE